MVLGKVLLWLTFSPYDVTHNVVPQDFKQRIPMEWKEIMTATLVGVDCDDVRCKPIKRVPVVVTGNHGTCVYIDIVPTLDENGNVEDEDEEYWVFLELVGEELEAEWQQQQEDWQRS